MKLHHIRNATLILEYNNHVLLVDPMLGGAKTMPPFTFFRFRPKKNPLVPLPEHARPALARATHCLVTHKHPDHIDKAAITWLKEQKLPVTGSIKDKAWFEKQQLPLTQTLDDWERRNFLTGHITGIPARHGYGFIAGPMSPVMGFYIEMPDAPAVYLSADTIYTPEVDKVLRELKPDVSILACGKAQLDLFKPLLMNEADILKFCKNASGKVVANHLEALNHCPVTRAGLRKILKENGLSEKVYIPEDGEIISLL